MKWLGFIISTAITLALIWLMDQRQGEIPPLGKFFHPAHGFWQNAEPTEPDLSADLHLPGLNDEVLIKFDDRMVPHIFAKNDHDLYYAQGYVTAMFRLWQMEIQTHAAGGRVSEIVGESALESDRLMRRSGMVFAAENAVTESSKFPEIVSMMDAYTDGVNAWIENMSYADYPIEYKLLDYQPESWNNLKSALLLKYMSRDLCGRDDDFESTNALNLFGDTLFFKMFPDFPDSVMPVMPDATPREASVDSPVSGTVMTASVYNHHPAYVKPDPMNGSNNWAINSDKSATGYPLLCSDPHLALNLPSIWFEIHLNSPNVNTYGVSLPGGPGVTIGFNEDIAWGMTNSGVDVRDWYQITYKDESRDEYLLDGEYKPTGQRIEEIKVRGGEMVYDTVIYTRWGPVVYDRNMPATDGQEELALRWTMHDPSVELKTLYMMNRGKSYEDYVEALKYYTCPAQNFVFATRTGDIAIWQRGNFPLKSKLQGKFIQDGSKSDNSWKGFIPFKHTPQSYNPDRGFVSSANQHPTDESYPYYYNGNFEYHRNQRLNYLLSEKEKLSVDDMEAFQQDNYNLFAAELLSTQVRTFLENAEFNGATSEYRSDILNWNYMYDPDLVAPTIFEAFWDTLYPMIWDEIYAAEMDLPRPKSYTTYQLIRDEPDFELFDIASTPEQEDLEYLVINAFSAAMKKLDSWKEKNGDDISWAKYKGTRVMHLARIAPFTVWDVPIGGNRGILNATSTTHGPSWRMVVELTPDGMVAEGVYPGGQSGNPGSPYYADFIDSWAAGEYYPLLFLQSADQPSDRIIHEMKMH